jgi:hypothetical protein
MPSRLPTCDVQSAFGVWCVLDPETCRDDGPATEVRVPGHGHLAADDLGELDVGLGGAFRAARLIGREGRVGGIHGQRTRAGDVADGIARARVRPQGCGSTHDQAGVVDPNARGDDP